MIMFILNILVSILYFIVIRLIFGEFSRVRNLIWYRVNFFMYMFFGGFFDEFLNSLYRVVSIL